MPLHSLKKQVSFCCEFLTRIHHDGTFSADFLHSYSEDGMAKSFQKFSEFPIDLYFLSYHEYSLLEDGTLLKFDF